jgi:hypothetical protein
MNSKKNIDIIRESYSPSAYAVRRGRSEYYEKLKMWLNSSLNIKNYEG